MWNWPEKEKYAAVKKTEGSFRSEKHLDFWKGAGELEVCPAIFGSFFVPVFLTMFLLYEAPCLFPVVQPWKNHTESILIKSLFDLLTLAFYCLVRTS